MVRIPERYAVDIRTWLAVCFNSAARPVRRPWVVPCKKSPRNTCEGETLNPSSASTMAGAIRSSHRACLPIPPLWRKIWSQAFATAAVIRLDPRPRVGWGPWGRDGQFLGRCQESSVAAPDDPPPVRPHARPARRNVVGLAEFQVNVHLPLGRAMRADWSSFVQLMPKVRAGDTRPCPLVTRTGAVSWPATMKKR